MIVISNELARNEVVNTTAINETPHKDIVPEFESMDIAHDYIRMARGIIGFENIDEYKIELQEGNIIYKLTGAPDEVPMFYIINPYLITPHYDLVIQDIEYELLGSPDFKDIMVFSILTLQDKMEESTCNLLGPILINNNTSAALQVINNSSAWGTKHLISNGKKIIEAHVV